MAKILKVASVVGIGLLLFFGVVLFAFYHLVQIGEFRRFLISEVERRTQLQVIVGEAELHMGRIVGISFKDFALLEPDQSRPMISAQRVFMRVALLPLLERRLVFYEIRFYQPMLQLARDEGGKVSVLDLIAHLLFQKKKELQFHLDLRQLKVEKGEVVFLDHREEGRPTVTHFRDINLNLRRIRAKDRPGSGPQGPVKVATHEGEEAALEFALETAIEKDGEKARLASKGKIVFPPDEFEIRKAWLDAETRLEALPASLLWDYYGHLLPVKSVHGTLGPRLHWQGSLRERIHVRGEINFGQLEIDAPDIFANVVTPGDGQLELEIQWTPEEIRFPRLNVRSKEINLAIQGAMRFLAEEDPYLEVSLTTPFLPALAARNYVPARTLQSPIWGYLIRAVNQGEVRLVNTGVSGRLSEIRRVFEPGFENHIWLDAELREAGANLAGDGYLPVRGVGGRVVLEKGVLRYRGLKGMYGLSRLTEVDGSHKGVLTGQGFLELRGSGEIDLGELRQQLRLALFPPQVLKIAEGLQELSGKAKVEASLRKGFPSPYQLEGRLSLDNARLRVGDVALSQVKGGISFSPKEIRADKITALLLGSPVTVRALLNQYLSDNATFDLVVDSSGAKAGTVTRLLLSLGSSQDPGTVRGTVRYQGSLASAENRRLSGSLEVLGVQPPWRLFGQPLREVVGRVRFDPRGIDFQDVKGRVVGSDFDFSGQWLYSGQPQWTFTFNSPEMDLGRLLSQIDGGPEDLYDLLWAKGRVALGKGRYEAFEFYDLKTDLTLENRQWRLEDFSARSLGGTVQGSGSFADSPEGLRFSVAPKIEGVPVKGFLSWFDMGTTEITGKINLTGNLDSSGKTGSERKRNLNGAFHLEIEDGTARRFRVLVQVLNVLDLSRWFSLKMPDINKEGIRFRKVTGDFKVVRGVYSTQNLLVDSDDLRITGAGEVDGPKGEIDFVIAVRPFPGLDSAVSFIPLIGQGLAAIRNSLMVASFRIRGPLDSPIITPAPLSTLSEFFFGALAIPKSIIGLPGEEKK